MSQPALPSMQHGCDLAGKGSKDGSVFVLALGVSTGIAHPDMARTDAATAESVVGNLEIISALLFGSILLVRRTTSEWLMPQDRSTRVTIGFSRSIVVIHDSSLLNAESVVWRGNVSATASIAQRH